MTTSPTPGSEQSDPAAGGDPAVHVEPQGPAAVLRLPGLVLRKASVGEMDNNAYLLTCTATGEQLLIDAAAEPERLLRLVEEGAQDAQSGLRDPAAPALATIVTTHRHHDHVGALAPLAEATGASTAAGAEDAPAIDARIDRTLEHGDEVRVGEQTLEVIALRGHTPGSVALLWRADGAADQLFTGDSLFPGGVGNTFGDAQAFASLIDDVEQRIFAPLEDATQVHPGHGDGTTLGAERGSLPQWRERGW